MPEARSHIGACLTLARTIGRSRKPQEIYEAALDALEQSLGVITASIWLVDSKGVPRVKACRGMSESCQRTLHAERVWNAKAIDPAPVIIPNICEEPSMSAHLPDLIGCGIAAMAIVPLVSASRSIGGLRLCYAVPHAPAETEMHAASLIAAQVSFAVDRMRREERALRSEEAAEQASRLKDEFLATLSHELRTPLNAVLGWVEILQASGLPPERTRHAIEVIGRNARLQAQLIEDILDISRIISGKLEIDRLPVFIPQLVDAAVSGIQPAASAKDIAIRKIIPDDLPPIQGDPKRLHQVLGNLLSNAVKFTPEQGEVEVRCRLDGETIEIEIRDNGVGIAPEFLPFVFDRFRQADSRSTRRHGGLGLGLAIARHLVEEHRGEIRANSAGAGKGTTVTMRLPIGIPDQEGVSIEPVAAPPVDLRMDGSTVVIVDDQRDSRELLGVLLERCGAHVVQCDGAEAALKALASVPVRLLVADIAMPEVDGYELIRRVRQFEKKMPAVAVSAYARPQDRGKALLCGYSAYCAKPIEPRQFLGVVREVLLAS